VHSGSAFPATLAFQIRELEKQTEGDLKLDAIVTVIDAENFVGYEDQSPTARMQASYTDIILIVSLHSSEYHCVAHEKPRTNGNTLQSGSSTKSSTI
jgi:G3E family GTPase